jgi:hypothetical protein
VNCASIRFRWLALVGVYANSRLLAAAQRPTRLEVAASPLAKTPYDLRHAAVSTYLDGGDALVRRRVQAALGYADTDNDTGSNPVTPTTPT